MKMLFIAFATIATLTATAQADTYVHGYTRSNGTYVEPHYRSDSNGTTSDNWSTKGNTNPYTGAAGTKTDTGYSNSYSNPYNSNSYGNTNSKSWND